MHGHTQQGAAHGDTIAMRYVGALTTIGALMCFSVLAQEIAPAMYSDVRLSDRRSKLLVAPHPAGQPDGTALYVLIDSVIRRNYRDELVMAYGSSCDVDLIVKGIDGRPIQGDMEICSDYKLNIFECVIVPSVSVRGLKPSVEQHSQRVQLLTTEATVCGRTAAEPPRAYTVSRQTLPDIVERVLRPEQIQRLAFVSKYASEGISKTLRAFDDAFLRALSGVGATPDPVRRSFAEDTGGQNYYVIHSGKTGPKEVVAALEAMGLSVGQCSETACPERFAAR